MSLSPAQLDLLMIALTLWPAVVVLRRLGLKAYMAVLLAFSLVIPLLGHMLLALYVATARWPNFPALPKPAPRVKL